MSGFFLYHKQSRPTGLVLASALDTPHGVERGREGRVDWVIRWGSRASYRLDYGAHQPRIVNSIQALTAASDKLGTLQTLRDAGVKVPDWSTNPAELVFPFLGRRIHHARGTDVVLCLQKGDYLRKPRDYYVKYIPTVREFRVHVVAGEVIRVQGKYLDEASKAVSWIRNYKHGFRFRAPRQRLHRQRLEAAVNSVSALGLDFGAVDLLIGDDNETYVLEVNTAPACSPLTAAGYVAAFQRLLNIPEAQIDYDRLNILDPHQDDGDTEDEVEGEEDL